MTRKATDDTRTIPFVDPDADRRTSIAEHVPSADGPVEPVFRDAANEVPGGRHPVTAVSLGIEDPVGAARYLAKHFETECVVFYGTEPETATWGQRVNYEPYLPHQRIVVPLQDRDAITRAFTRAFDAVRARATARPLVKRMGRGGADLRQSVETILVDALAPPKELESAYAAVIRGALSGIGSGQAEPFPQGARRSLQSALRRIELLRGAEERDRVAHTLAAVLDQSAQGPPNAYSQRVESDEDLDRVRGELQDVARASGLDAPGVQSLVEGVLAVVRASLVDGHQGHLDAGYSPGSAEVTLTWTDDENRSARLAFRGRGPSGEPDRNGQGRDSPS